MRHDEIRLAALLGLGIALGGCDQPDTSEMYEVEYTEEREICDHRNPLRNAYFGDVHVHTAHSFDAYTNDNRNGPDEAYEFAQGEPILLPPLDAGGVGTQTVQLEQALDFAAVTDHAEYLGEIAICDDPTAAGYDVHECVTLRNNRTQGTFMFGVKLGGNPERFSFCGEDGSECAARQRSVWERMQEAAETAYDRSAECGFTSFVAYEYSGAPELSNLHRNVIFRTAAVPSDTTSYYEQSDPEGLWREVDGDCEAVAGCDVLMIPHNSNLSNGKMFLVETVGDVGEARENAELRARLEPLVEVVQHKGESECMNGFADAYGEPDEFCDFEKTHAEGFDDCGDGVGANGLAGFGCAARSDFVRTALLLGLAEGERLGVNPFKVGLSAATDTHNATPGAVAERGWIGHNGLGDTDPVVRLDGPTMPPGTWRYNPGGITGVWAQENSRDALFVAMQRKEAWGTSGPRISVRFFGGWDLPDDLCADPQLVEKGYQLGVPMGRDLRDPNGGQLTFVISALRDPAADGAPLERLQIIKGFITAAGEPRVEVHDVITDTGDYATDPASCGATGGGADSLCGTWTDPSFDPDRPAYYYARVLEHPTCRWSSFICNELAGPTEPVTCSNPDMPRLIRERAWTSPIWFEP